MTELEARMREVILALAMTSNGTTTSYDSSGGGAIDYYLIDDRGRGKGRPGEAPHLVFARRWDAADDDDKRRAVLDAARNELDRIRRSRAPDPAVLEIETKDKRDARIVKDGADFSAQDVAIAMRCGIRDVWSARQAAGLDIEFGRPPVNGRKMTREQRTTEILHLTKLGMNPFQIAKRLGLPNSSVRDTLARRNRPK